VRLLLDNNILVSSLLSPHGPPGQLAEAWRDHRFEVLARPKVQRLIGTEAAEALVADITAAALVVVPRRGVIASSDPEDNLILGTALPAKPT
jgi:uncharacterized protein